MSLPAGITEIGGWAFYSCSRLETINLPASLKTIKPHAFDTTTGLKKIVLPKGLTSIGSSAFLASGLTETDIPDSVSELGKSAFWGCSFMTTCKMGAGIKKIPEDAFMNCYALEKVIFPANVTTIGNGAFCKCYSLTGTLMIPDTVQSIEDYAFQSTAFRIVVFGSRLKSIGNYFINTGGRMSQGATAPSAFKFTGDFPSISPYTFYDIYATVEYPANNTTWKQEGLQNYGGTLKWKKQTDEYYSSGLTENGFSWYIDWNSTLYINGSGKMDDFGYSGGPWSEDCNVIAKELSQN